MLIDTHCHLADPAFDADREAAIERMRAAGVDRVVVVESRLEQLERTREWIGHRTDCRLATACHPHDAARWNPDMCERLAAAWHDPLVVAVGEIGLDYHYDHAPRDVQRDVFAEQLAVAVGVGLPVVIHAREADADVVAVLHEQPAATIVLHSFSSGAVLRDAALDAGWYFSFSGMVTFRSWDQDETVCAVPADRLLIETDAPYLAPVPHRGRRNEPAFVAEVASAVARARGVPMEQVAQETTANANRLFWSAR